MDQIINKKISGFIDNDDNIILSFKNTSLKLKLNAQGDCCSYSWFDILDDSFSTIINKTFKNVYITDEIINLPESGNQEVDINTIMIMEFTDSEPFKFVFRNSSNGYYCGWIDITVE